MCGICGHLGPCAQGVLERMVRTMKHRGPDANGILVSGDCGLGHTRLSIVDLSDAANQPMATPDGRISLSYNGEIYNFRELRREYQDKGYDFTTDSDTEVLLPAFLEHGPALVNHLDGMFALAIHDARSGELHLFRDRFGKKPLFYFRDRDTWFFASELKALLATGRCPTALSEDAYKTFLALQYCLTEECILREVRKVPPAGHVTLYPDGRSSEEIYWTLDAHPLPKIGGDKAEILRRLFFRAVEKRLMGDVPIGVLLSGGMDSGAVVAAMDRASDAPVNTFTAGFGLPDDEFAAARLMAEQAKTNHTELHISAQDLASELEHIIRFQDEPLADGGGFATYFVARRLREHVKVALVGEGGDELFGGYSWHRLGVGAARLFPEWLRKRLYLHANSFAPARLRKHAAQRVFPRMDSAGREGGKGFLHKMTGFERMNLLPNSLLMKVDRMTMAHSVEARVPFLDEDLLRFTATLPPGDRFNKSLFREAMQGILPEATLSRKKQGFRLPVTEWLGHDLRDFSREIVLDDGAHCRSLFSRRELESFFRKPFHFLQKIQRNAMVWRLLVFEVWKRAVPGTDYSSD